MRRDGQGLVALGKGWRLVVSTMPGADQIWVSVGHRGNRACQWTACARKRRRIKEDVQVLTRVTRWMEVHTLSQGSLGIGTFSGFVFCYYGSWEVTLRLLKTVP